MKKQFTSVFFLLIASFILVSSCNKNGTVVVKTKTELISTGSWKFKGATAGGTDVSGNLQACQKDNVYTFVAAGTGTADEGATKCNAADPQTNPFTWNFASSETMLHISTILFSGGSNDFTLISLTETELSLSQDYTPPFGPIITIVVTFQH